MKLKDILNISENSKNKQSVWNPKKRIIKEVGLTEEQILELKIPKKVIK